MPVNSVAENVFGYMGAFFHFVLLLFRCSHVFEYRSIMLGYSADTTNMEELEV